MSGASERDREPRSIRHEIVILYTHTSYLDRVVSAHGQADIHLLSASPVAVSPLFDRVLAVCSLIDVVPHLLVLLSPVECSTVRGLL